MELKLGDVVQVKSDLVRSREYGRLTFQYFMMKDKGCTGRITEVASTGAVKIDNTSGAWFDPEMLTFLNHAEEGIPIYESHKKYEVGDRIMLDPYYTEKTQCNHAVVSEMLKFRGKIVTIREVGVTYGVPYYRIKEDDNSYNYDHNLVLGLPLGELGKPKPELPELTVKKKYAVGDKIVIDPQIAPWDNDVTPEMVDYAGKTLTVKEVRGHGKSTAYFVTENTYYWLQETIVGMKSTKPENKDVLKWVRAEMKKDAKKIEDGELTNEDFAYWAGAEEVYLKVIKKLGGKI